MEGKRSGSCEEKRWGKEVGDTWGGLGRREDDSTNYVLDMERHRRMAAASSFKSVILSPAEQGQPALQAGNSGEGTQQAAEQDASSNSPEHRAASQGPVNTSYTLHGNYSQSQHAAMLEAKQVAASAVEVEVSTEAEDSETTTRDSTTLPTLGRC